MGGGEISMGRDELYGAKGSNNEKTLLVCQLANERPKPGRYDYETPVLMDKMYIIL